jgi:hypothetical protein
MRSTLWAKRSISSCGVRCPVCCVMCAAGRPLACVMAYQYRAEPTAVAAGSVDGSARRKYRPPSEGQSSAAAGAAGQGAGKNIMADRRVRRGVTCPPQPRMPPPNFAQDTAAAPKRAAPRSSAAPAAAAADVAAAEVAPGPLAKWGELVRHSPLLTASHNGTAQHSTISLSHTLTLSACAAVCAALCRLCCRSVIGRVCPPCRMVRRWPPLQGVCIGIFKQRNTSNCLLQSPK